MIRPDSPLLTDLYQLTMLQGYLEQGMEAEAVFEFFVRKLPPARNFLVAAGLEQVLDYVENLRFESAELEYLAATGRFNTRLLDWLEKLRFSGDVYAMAEGTIFFSNEPILRIVAPLPQAQLIETRIINLLHFEILIASKAARCVLAAPQRQLVDFGLRRAHGAEAGLLAARASYVAGFNGTSNVLAQAAYGIPIYGTMAHSFVQAHDDEALAFEHFAHAQPNNVVLLIDTYDTEAAAAKVVALAPRLQARGITVRAVRIDSGDLAEHARRVRAIFDRGGLPEVRIFASGNLDEYTVYQLVANGAPIDGFGVGTHMDTSSDMPYLDCAYKLQEYAGQARRKRSEGKATWPGRKQIYRCYDSQGRMSGDTLTVEGDVQAGEPLLNPVMRQGRRLEPSPSLDAARARCAAELTRLPPALRTLEPAAPYTVAVAPALEALATKVDERAGGGG